jgi:LysR family transcriptional regulator, nitrogen assimilation regulatory protein
MNLRQLRYFVSIAELGSISAASQRLGVAQPSLSQTIRQLEVELGVELLVRSPRGVGLTESGEVLLDRALSILNALDLTANEIRDRFGEVRGSVSFGVPSSASNVLSVPLAETVRHQFPKIMLRTMEAMSGFVQEWLAQGQLDLGILYDVERARYLKAQPLVVEELFLVTAADGWSSKIGPDGIAETHVSLQDCASLPMILPHRSHGLRDTIERFVGSRGLSLSVVLEMDSLTNIKTLVKRGSGYTILAHAAVYEEVQRGTLAMVPLRDPVMRRTVFLVRHASRPVTQAAREIERVILDITAELVRKKLWIGELQEAP